MTLALQVAPSHLILLAVALPPSPPSFTPDAHGTVPWDIYAASRTRRILSTTAATSTDDPELARRRAHASSLLLRTELLSLSLTVLSPFLGASLLYWLRGVLSDPDRFVNGRNIRLFVLASGIKPWLHLSRVMRARSLRLQ